MKAVFHESLDARKKNRRLHFHSHLLSSEKMSQLVFNEEIVFDERKYRDWRKTQGDSESLIEQQVAYQRETFKEDPEKYYLQCKLQQICQERNVPLLALNYSKDDLHALLARIKNTPKNHFASVDVVVP